MGTGDSPSQQPKPWLEEALALRAAKEAEKAERKARGPKPRPILTLVCQFCGREFQATRKDAKFCPRPLGCGSNASYRRKREELPILKRRALRLSRNRLPD